MADVSLTIPIEDGDPKDAAKRFLLTVLALEWFCSQGGLWLEVGDELVHLTPTDLNDVLCERRRSKYRRRKYRKRSSKK